MRAVIGLLLLFSGAELVYLVVTGKLGSQLPAAGGTGGGPDEQPVQRGYGSGIAPVHLAASTGIARWGTMSIATNGGLLA